MVKIQPAAGKTYLDVLKAVRDSKLCDKVVEMIYPPRRIANDTLLLRCRIGADSAKVEEIARTVVNGGGLVTLTIPMTTVVCSSLDACTTAEELRGAIHQQHGVNLAPKDISLRMFRNGLQSARMKVPKRAAIGIIGKRLLVGLCSVLLWERKKQPAELERCFKCMRLGHRAARCQEENRRRFCLRCGQDDHRLRACTNKPKCLDCGGEHRTGALLCVQGAQRGTS
uniref:CCHC-type domain-containing protein n=1 Tax=Anopheles maculatus TaxID=74869 RepID=A0A182SN30_9DIPT